MRKKQMTLSEALLLAIDALEATQGNNNNGDPTNDLAAVARLSALRKAIQ